MTVPTLKPAGDGAPTEGAPRAPASSNDTVRVRHSALVNAVVLVSLWVALVVVTTIKSPDFISYATLVSVAFGMTIVGIVAVGSAWVTISGGLVDLSIPSSTAVAALSTTASLPLLGSWLGSTVGILAGAAFGLVNGLLIVLCRLNPIVVTLATNFVGLGAINLFFARESLDLSSGLRKLSVARTLGLPSTWWFMVALVLVMSVVATRTRYGQHALAVGGSPVAARRQGIRLSVVRVSTFTLMGACAGLAGVLYAGQTQLLDTGSTQGLLFPAVTAVIVSGFSLRGGEGSMPVLLIGVGFLATIPAALVFLGFNSSWQQFWQGALLTGAVALDGLRQKRRSRS